MDANELKKILDDHRAWVTGEGGKRANLYEADLCGADLRWADLYGADLRRANLRWADLRGANLYKADLCGAILDNAILPNGWRVYTTAGGGSARRQSMLVISHDETYVTCGCFRGSLDEFVTQIETEHADNPQHLAYYRGVVALFRAMIEHGASSQERKEG